VNSLNDIEQAIDRLLHDAVPAEQFAEDLLAFGESILGHWLLAHGEEPTAEAHEGFRLLALHRQGAKGDVSFNACRETCRELAYHYNLLALDPAHERTAERKQMMVFVAKHLFLFVSGKLEVQELGDFCCSSKPLRQRTAC
jgi:hypothetical protein